MNLMTSHRGNKLHSVRERCQMAITELILSKVEEQNQDFAFQAVSEAKKLNSNAYFVLIEPIESWFVKWALMKYWVLTHQRRRDI